ncbi:lipocalin family protein [Brucella sp. 21LCYQ03]|nr:lipocalin family protein [Brucella sp. 21LCYQ03]
MLISCSKDDDPREQEIIGTWQITHYDGRVTADHPEEFPEGRTITFQSGGTFYESGSFRDGSGTYVIKDRDLIVTIGGNTVFTYIIMSITEDQLILDELMAGTAIRVQLKRVR